jgi:hypothetical protein
MSKPDISVVIEPSKGTSVVYEPVAPNDSQSKPSGIVCLQLTITNNGSKQIHLNKVKLSFSSPPSVPDKIIPVPTTWWPPGGTGVNIAPAGQPGSTYVWNFLRESGENDAAVLPSPAPASMTLSLFFDGFTSPWKVTKTLAPHRNPVAGSAYLFPAQTSDLRAGEFWGASSDTHATGAAGSQLFGYDMNVIAWDENANSLNRLLPGKSGDKNEDYRIWGKKIYAMADGIVLQRLNKCPNNDPPLANQFNGNVAHDAQLWTDQANSFWGAYDNSHGGESVVHAGAGNHFYIQHGNEVVLYAHMQKGSLNKDILSGGVGATVNAGDFLGLAGNSGNASEPHLHIHAVRGTAPETGPLRPLLFRDILTIDPASLSFPSTYGPWATMTRQGPPIVPWTSAARPSALIWPAAERISQPERPNIYELAIDPLALILRHDIYVRLTLPDPPPVEVIEAQIRQLVKTMSPNERKLALTQVKAFRTVYARILERELSTAERRQKRR